MSKITKKEVWDILEDRLLTISETRIGEHLGEAKLAVSVVLSAGRDEDREFIDSNLFDFYCKLASLHIEPTRELMFRTLDYLENGGSANFRQASLEV